MRERTETESFYSSLIRSGSITVSDHQRVVNLVNMGKANDVTVEYEDLSDQYGAKYEVFINERATPKPYFDQFKYEKDTINYNIKLDPRNEALARELLKQTEHKNKDIDTLIKDILFSYAYQEFGKNKIDAILSTVNAEYMDEN